MTLAASIVVVALASAAAPPAKLLSAGLWRQDVPTQDGGRIVLYRYVPAVPKLGAPVVLVPELGCTRAVFDSGGFGLAPFLQAKGREVFVVEPRGHGAAGEATTLRDLVRFDLPAALAHVRKLTRATPDVVGHGFGGSLLLAAIADSQPGEIGRVIAIATPVEPAIPNATFEAALTSDRAFGEDTASFEFLFHRRGLIPAARVEHVRRATARPLRPQVRGEWLAWAREGDLELGAEDSVRRRLARYAQKTYLILPLLDYVGHPEYAAMLRDAQPELVEIRILSKLYLHAEDYTHLSVLLGEGAPSDVFEPLLKFLEGSR